MARKAWELDAGERTVNTGNPDVLLGDAVSARRRKQLQRQEEIDDLEHKARKADLEKKTATSEAAVEKAGEKKEAEGPMKFEVKGGVNLGTIDLQEERKEARGQLERMKKEADDNARATGQENQQLRDQIHAQEIKVLEITFKAQMEALTKAIESNASKGNFAEQLNAARAIAEEIGYQKGGTPGGGSEVIQIELKKLDFEHTRAMRQMARDDKAEERRWQMELRRLDDEREARKAELAREQKKDEMFAKAPEVFGRAMGRAIVEGGGAEAEAPVTSRAKMPGIEAGVGESGEAECIKCHQPVAIGPTARMAVCAECGARYPIKRVAVESQGYDSIAGQEPQTAQEELEE